MSELVLLRDEELKMQLRPHVFSFFYLYIIFFLLLVWAYIIYDFFVQDKFTAFPLYEFIIKIPFANEVLAGAMIWSLASDIEYRRSALYDRRTWLYLPGL